MNRIGSYGETFREGPQSLRSHTYQNWKSSHPQVAIEASSTESSFLNPHCWILGER
jgi:hypothetical protein